MKTVTPKSARGFNLTILSIFGIGPKWNITCGNCEITFSARIPLVDTPGIICPYCKITNILELTISKGYK